MRRVLITLRWLACAATVVAVIGAVGLSGAALAQDPVPRGRLSSNGCERTTLSGVPSDELAAYCRVCPGHRPAGRHQTTVGPLGSQEPTFRYSAAERALAIPNVARWLAEALQTTVGPLGLREPTFQYSAAKRAPAIPNVARWLEEALRTTVGPLGSQEPTFQYSAAERAPAIPNVAIFSDQVAREAADRVPTAHPLSEAKVSRREPSIASSRQVC
jgi:hypothetical protein